MLDLSVLARSQTLSLFERASKNLASSIASEVKTGNQLVTLEDLKIRTKDRQLVSFRPNFVQSTYLDMLKPGWKVSKDLRLQGLREIILKARQEGITTFWAMLYLMDTLNVPYTHTVMIAHDTESTEKLFQMVQRAFNELPPDKKPTPKYASKREFYWPEIDSSYYVGTAGDRDFGRGLTVNNVHGSEVAAWADAKRIVAGLLESVPEQGNIVLETTAQGIGNYYHSEYMAAQEGESAFIARFFPWILHPDYKLKLDPGEVIEPTEEEDKLVKHFNLSLEQIKWRRLKVKALKSDFPQEYPITPEEAFLSTGNAYFSLEKLKEQAQSSREALSGLKLPPLLARLRSNELLVFSKPDKERKYVLTADTAEGLNEDGNADYCAADVYDFETYEQVCHLHGRWDTHDYGMLLAELGTLYNHAWLGVERNNHGHAVLNAILHSTDYPRMTPAEPYRGVYYHRDWDERKRMRVRKPGWPTTTKTKFFALDALATLIDDEDIAFNSKATIRECMSYVKLPGGKAGGQTGSHDDRVIAAAVFAGMMATRQKPSEKKKGWVGKRGGFV